MSNVSKGAHRERGVAAEAAMPAAVGAPPSLRWSDLWEAPLHDFPIRDEILYQYLPLSRESEVLEIGPGSGFTAFRLARRVRRLTLVDVADAAVLELQQRLRSLSNVRCVCADVTQREFLERVPPASFDAAFGLDVFEYVTDPEACLKNLAASLRPGGQLLLTFPNVPPPVGDGVTYFTREADVSALLARGGFSRWHVFAVRPRSWAALAHRWLHDLPLRAYRRTRPGDRHARPQTYEATWAFQHRNRLQPYKVALHVLWACLGWVMRMPGPVFVPLSSSSGILNQQLVIRAWR